MESTDEIRGVHGIDKPILAPSTLPSDILSFQSDIVELEHAPVPGGVRWVLYAVLGIFVFVIIWSIWAQVDRVVTARGKIVSSNKHIQVQPLRTSVVRSIDVKVGDKVEKGQVLALLDPTLVSSDLTSVEQQFKDIMSRTRRLQAELDGSMYVPFDDEEPKNISLQKQLFKQRQQERNARLGQFEKRIDRLKLSLVDTEQKHASIEMRLEISKEIEAMHINLQENGYMSRSKYLEVRDRHLELLSELAHLKIERQVLGQELAETALEKDAFEAGWYGELTSELNESLTKYLNLEQELQKAIKMNSLVTLTAEEAAIVLEVGEFMPGSVAKEAEILMVLMPLDSVLLVKVDVAAKDIGRIREEDEARVKLDAFPFQRHGLLSGQVDVISEDAFERDSVPGSAKMLIYRVGIKLLGIELKDVPTSYRLMPGMEATVEIKVGTRRIIEYLIYPIVRAVGESMREP